METKCDVCGSTENIQCEILTKGDMVDRIYHLCPEHWVSVYRKTLDDFVENNEYKVNSYIKMVADKLIVDDQSLQKSIMYVDENGQLDLETLDPVEVRRIRPYSEDMDED